MQMPHKLYSLHFLHLYCLCLVVALLVVLVLIVLCSDCCFVLIELLECPERVYISPLTLLFVSFLHLSLYIVKENTLNTG
jgi:hypothetical protein